MWKATASCSSFPAAAHEGCAELPLPQHACFVQPCECEGAGQDWGAIDVCSCWSFCLSSILLSSVLKLEACSNPDPSGLLNMPLPSRLLARVATASYTQPETQTLPVPAPITPTCKDTRNRHSSLQAQLISNGPVLSSKWETMNTSLVPSPRSENTSPVVNDACVRLLVFRVFKQKLHKYFEWSLCTSFSEDGAVLFSSLALPPSLLLNLSTLCMLAGHACFRITQKQSHKNRVTPRSVSNAFLLGIKRIPDHLSSRRPSFSLPSSKWNVGVPPELCEVSMSGLHPLGLSGASLTVALVKG